ncbi:MAG: integrin alpha [Phycisphaerales bacterium]
MIRRCVEVALAAIVSACAPALAQPSLPAGHYAGTWTNTTFSSSGAIRADGVIVASTLTMTIDADGGVFGLPDPPPFTLSGPITAGGWSAALTGHAVFGDLSVSVNAAGQVTINGSNPPSGFITTYTATGTFTPSGQINLAGHIEFVLGVPADTTIVCNRTAYSTAVSPSQIAQGQAGFSVAGSPDLNGDARGDIIVGAPLETHATIAMAGRVHVFNGVGGAPFRTIGSPAPESAGRFGWSVSSIPDTNGDGKADLLVGAPNENPATSPFDCGRAYIYSGANGSLLFKLIPPAGEATGLFGYSVAGVADVNGDGRGDAIVGAPREDPGTLPADAGRVHVYSGATGLRLYTLGVPVSVGPAANDYFGWSVGGVPDANGDARGDIIVGMPQGTGVPTGNPGRAFLYSGSNGAMLRAFSSPGAEADGLFGRSVAGVPDTNGDARGDVVIGAPNEDPGTAPDGTGRAHLFSGATGALLFKLLPPTPTAGGNFGMAVAGMTDTNGDGRGDIVVGAPGEGSADQGRAYIYSGATGLRLVTLASRYPEASGAFGASVSGLPNVNAANLADVAVGAPGEDPGTAPLNAGRAYWFRR